MVLRQVSKIARERKVQEDIGIEHYLWGVFKADKPIIIADIGACEGLSSIRYSRLFPNAHFHLFEPRSDNIELIRKNWQEFEVRNPIEVHGVALSDKDGRGTFYQSHGFTVDPGTDWNEGNKSSSILEPKEHLNEHQWCKFNKVSVNCRTLDSFRINIDFIHIDVQGAELKVFQGGLETLKNVKMIWMEVSQREMYSGQPLKEDIEKFMTDHGFNKVFENIGNNPQGDQLWQSTQIGD